MRIVEIHSPDDPYRDTDLALSDYRSSHNPRTSDLRQPGVYKDVSELWDIIDDLLDNGAEPKKVPLLINTLLATQDWLSTTLGDGPVWDELEDRPVILDMGGKRYILDGHNRISRAKRAGRTSIPVYYFQK